jgi:hypothetical protein
LYFLQFFFFLKAQLTPAQKNAIAAVIMPQKFKQGDRIVSEGDDAASFYIVKEVSLIN